MRTAAELGFLEDFSAVEVLLLHFIACHVDPDMIQIDAPLCHMNALLILIN